MKTRTLPVRTCSTLDGHERTAVHASVFCPIKRDSHSVEGCRTCDRLVEIRTDERGAPTSVSCHVPAPEPRERERSASMVARVYGARAGMGAMLEHVAVSDVMTRDVVCVSPSLPVRDAWELLSSSGFSGVPVVDERRHPVGILSRTDLVREQADALEDEDALDLQLRVSDVMTTRALVVPETASLAQAAAMMAFERLHRVPAVSVEGRVVGILTATDVVRWIAEQAGYVVGDARAVRQDPQKREQEVE